MSRTAGRLAMLGRYFHTTRPLRTSQLYWLAYRRLRPFRQVAGLPELGRPVAPGTVPRFLDPVAPDGAADELRFLNVGRRIDPGNMDWVAQGMPKLWCYNLHYFDYLHWPSLPEPSKAALIDSWIAGNPQHAANAWEPYTLSLRVVNWVKYLLRREPTLPVPPAWLQSLALQLVWLTRNLEYHLLANHLLKNAKALFIGGSFFAGEEAGRIRRQGLRMLVDQAAEQMLPDGGHYERSPMYHLTCLEDFLDAVALIAAEPSLAEAGEAAVLGAAAGRGLKFLEGIVHADGEIPLFNDSAFGIAPAAGRMVEWGRRVLSSSPAGADSFANRPAPAGDEESYRICFPDTGYYGYRRGGDSLVMDCGPVGPDYQPGHAHADALSFELCLDGQRVIVDSGTYDYEPGPLRQQLRGTRAHNTVTVDGADQSEVWGVFRVARRARPVFAELGQWQDGVLEFRGVHDGYRRLPGSVTHERRVTVHQDAWLIHDLLTGQGEHLAESCLHLHPGCTAQRTADRQLQVSRQGRPLLLITATGGSLALEPSVYCPEFGLRHDNIRIVLHNRGSLPMELGFRIERL